MGSFNELERRISEMQAPANTTSDFDLCGFFPNPGKPATIEIEGQQSFEIGAPLLEPVAMLVLNVLLMSRDAGSLLICDVESIASIFEVVEWDPQQQYLKVRRKEKAFTSRVTDCTYHGMTIATLS